MEQGILYLEFGRGELGVTNVTTNGKLRGISVEVLPHPMPIGSRFNEYAGKPIYDNPNVVLHMHFENKESLEVLHNRVHRLIEAFEMEEN